MKELLLGIVLGDGYLEPRGKSVRLQVNHALRFAPYIQWKREQLMALGPSPLHSNDNNGNPFWRFVTKSHPQLIALRALFYPKALKLCPKRLDNC